MFARIQAVVEGRLVQSKLGSEAFQVFFIKCAAVLARLAVEQLIVVFPKCILVGGALTGFASPL